MKIKLNVSLFVVTVFCLTLFGTSADAWSIFNKDKEIKTTKAAPTFEMQTKTPLLHVMKPPMRHTVDSLIAPQPRRLKGGGYPSELSDPAERREIREIMLDAYFGIRAMNLLADENRFRIFTGLQLKSGQTRSIFDDLVGPRDRFMNDIIGRFADSMGQLASKPQINSITSCDELSLTDCYAEWMDFFTELKTRLVDMLEEVDSRYCDTYCERKTQERFCVEARMCSVEIVGETGTRQTSFWADFWNGFIEKNNQMAEALKEQAVYLGAPPPEI